MNNFGKNLRRARKKAGLTQAQAAKGVNCWGNPVAGQSLWSQYETGKCIPSIAQAERLADAVGATLEDVIRNSE